MVNALHFGAAGDGAADDTAALQHALEAGDGVLELEKGTYRISRPLVLDLTKQGYGAVLGKGGSARIIMTGPGPALRFLGDHQGTAVPASVKPQTWDKERFPCVNGIEIVGAHPEAVGIELRKTMQMTITQSSVRQCRYGVHLVERNRNFLLSAVHIYDNAEYGVFFDHCNLHQINIAGCHISYNKRAGIRSHGGDVHNLQITGNDIEYNNQPGVDASPNGEPRGAEIWFEAADGVISEVTIASNTIQATIQPGGANIRIWGTAGRPAPAACLIAITGNVLGSQTRGIELREAQRVTIAGNTIYDASELSLDIARCSGIAVSANTFTWKGVDSDPPRDGIRFEDCDNCSLTGLVAQRLSSGTAEQGGGITLLRCREMAVSGCQILDPLIRGIDVIDCHRCRISDNTILDRRSQPVMRHALRVTGGQNLVQHNLWGGATDVVASIAEGNFVQGNVLV